MRILIFSILLYLFSFNNTVKKVELPSPPGTSKVDDNFYVDRWEISNIDYKEYLYWTAKVFGEDSEEVKNAGPDENIWLTTNLPNKNYLSGSYFRNSLFNIHPVVGISWQQANDYLRWRTDRVYEMILIEKEIIPVNPDQDRDSHFTWRKYKKGNYLNIQPTELPPLPVYSLPAEEEWERMANAEGDKNLYPYGIKKTNAEIEKLCRKNKFCFNTVENKKEKINDENSKGPVTVMGEEFKHNKFKLFNTIGNVCEMTNNNGVAKGGSWKHGLEECKIVNTFNYDGPQAWVGFRGVCRYVDINDL